MTEYEFILEDRISKIKAINEQYDLEHKSYIAFSGGKDSLVLSRLIDLALPNNQIPRVYANTGIEYSLMLKFVKELYKKDNRIVILNQNKNIKKTLETYGYPFKSKVHAYNVDMFNRLGKTKTIRAYLGEEPTKNGKYKTGQFRCLSNLAYQFECGSTPFKISHLCCSKLKKELSLNWQIENKKSITITGLRKEEGGARLSIGCLTNNNTKFNPLAVIKDDWENEFIKVNNIELCALYYPPYNFKRTGCKGCPFDKNLNDDLETMYKLLPNDYKQCIYLWKPVYDEYIRIGYRLKKYPHKEGSDK